MRGDDPPKAIRGDRRNDFTAPMDRDHLEVSLLDSNCRPLMSPCCVPSLLDDCCCALDFTFPRLAPLTNELSSDLVELSPDRKDDETLLQKLEKSGSCRVSFHKTVYSKVQLNTITKVHTIVEKDTKFNMQPIITAANAQYKNKLRFIRSLHIFHNVHA